MSGEALGASAVVAHVALGANLGHRRETLEGALRELAGTEGIRVDAVSSWFETAAVGGPAGQPDYLNGVCRVRTTLSAEALLARLQELERAAGRDRRREVRNGPRRLDLDLLLYGEVELEGPELIVPHPRMTERLFVLEPLASISPDVAWRDPAAGGAARTATQWRDALAAEAVGAEGAAAEGVGA